MGWLAAIGWTASFPAPDWSCHRLTALPVITKPASLASHKIMPGGRFVGSVVGGVEPDVPVPLSPADCGDPALLLITMLAASNPIIDGVNATLMVQEAPGARDVPQVDVSEKSLA